MKTNLIFKKIDNHSVSPKQFDDIVAVEQSGSEDCYTEEQLRQIYLENENYINYACFDGDKIVAHIATNPNSKRRNGSIYIINITVLPDYRRQGIGQKLIHAVCKYYLENNYSLPMSVSVDKDNQNAINLYLKVGFEIKDPICEADEDDEQYILDATLSKLNNTTT